jgi:GMP synthase-like glutamine amidotransferase
MQWHYDVVTVPPGSQELARSAVGPQAWQMGRSFCTQFHPEANETMIRRWANSDGGSAELLKYGIKPDQLIEESRCNVAESQPAADHLVDWFLDCIVGST